MKTSTETILFSDVVSSTRYLWQLGDGDVVRQMVLRVMRQAAADHGGREVKSLGDGLMVVFGSAVDGVEAAVAMQQGVGRLRPVADHPVRVRVGMSIGEVTCEDDDYFGLPVVEAARLCEVAEGGQILVSDLVRILVGSRTTHTFEHHGSMELRGLPGPLETTELRWSPAAEMALPAPLTTSSRSLFVGREAAVAALAAAADEAARGQRRTVLVTGEPGIGKTRLVAEAAVAAQRGGCTVLYGRCDAELGVAYQPFAEALRHYLRNCRPELLAAHVASYGAELGHLGPELRQRLPGGPLPPGGEPEGDRLRLFEAVDGLLTLASSQTPLMVVLDDLHWADRASLLLLRHVVRSEAPAATLVVATYRDTDVDREHPLTSTLAELRRCPGVERLHLGGLDGPEIAALLAKAAGHDLDENGYAFAGRVHAETRGNPYFATEILRHLVETRAVYQQEGTWRSDVDLDQLGLPDSVRDVVGGRLCRLSDAAYQVLVAAAVIGSRFVPGLLQRTGTTGSTDAVVQGLDEALRAQLVVESEQPTPGGYAFAHDIVRQTIYGQLSSARRHQLHRQVALAIEQLKGEDDPRSVAALAHHFAEAAPIGEWAKAGDYALAAARHALGQMAHEEAALVLERGLRALDTAPRVDLERRCDLLLTLSEVRVRALDFSGTRDVSLTAAGVARAIGSPERLAEAAYWYSARCVAGERDEVGIAMGEEALAGMGSSPPASRARALAVLAQVRSFAGDNELAETLSREALDLARQTGDENALALALYARYHSLWGSPRIAEQLAIAGQLLACPVAMPSGWLASVDAHRLLTLARLALGDLAGFREGTADVERIGTELKSRYFLTLASLWGTCRALMEGRFADGEILLKKTGALAGDDRNFRNGLAAQVFYLSFEQGRLDHMEPLVSEVCRNTPGLIAFRAALALTFLEVGQHERARSVFEELAGDGFAHVPRDLVWPGCVALLSEVCAGLGDAHHADVLYRLFAEHSGLLVVTANGLHCPGAADRYLAMLAATAGRAERAEPHFRAALELEEGIGALPLAARTRLWYARMLLERDDGGDRKEATELLSAAAATARPLGMNAIAEQAGALLSRHG